MFNLLYLTDGLSLPDLQTAPPHEVKPLAKHIFRQQQLIYHQAGLRLSNEVWLESLGDQMPATTAGQGRLRHNPLYLSSSSGNALTD
jgi:hypothetical protein